MLPNAAVRLEWRSQTLPIALPLKHPSTLEVIFIMRRAT